MQQIEAVFARIDWYSILIGGAIATIITYIFYRLQISKKLPRYCVKSINIIESSLSRIKDLNVLFKGAPVTNLNSVTIAFWNAGSRAIRREDLVGGHVEFRIAAGTILDCDLVYVDASKKNGVTVSKDGAEQGFVAIAFDYLDHDDGCVFKIYHDNKGPSKIIGNSEIIEASPLREIPYLRGMPVKRDKNIKLSRLEELRDAVLRIGRVYVANPWQSFVAFGIIALVSTVLTFEIPTQPSRDEFGLRALATLYAVMSGLFMAVCLFLALRYPKMPKKISDALEAAI